MNVRDSHKVEKFGRGQYPALTDLIVCAPFQVLIKNNISIARYTKMALRSPPFSVGGSMTLFPSSFSSPNVFIISQVRLQKVMPAPTVVISDPASYISIGTSLYLPMVTAKASPPIPPPLFHKRNSVLYHKKVMNLRTQLRYETLELA